MNCISPFPFALIAVLCAAVGSLSASHLVLDVPQTVIRGHPFLVTISAKALLDSVTIKWLERSREIPFGSLPVLPRLSTAHSIDKRSTDQAATVQAATVQAATAQGHLAETRFIVLGSDIGSPYRARLALHLSLSFRHWIEERHFELTVRHRDYGEQRLTGVSWIGDLSSPKAWPEATFVRRVP